MREYCTPANTTSILPLPSPVSSSYSQFQQYASNSAVSPKHLDHPEDLHIILNCLQAPVLFLLSFQISNFTLLLKNACWIGWRWQACPSLPVWGANAGNCQGHSQRGSPTLSATLADTTELIRAFPLPVVRDKIQGSKRICGFIICYSKYLLMVIRQKE